MGRENEMRHAPRWAVAAFGAAMLVLALALAPRAAWTAVVTAGVSTGILTGGNTLAVPHTVSAGANRYLLVGVSVISTGGAVDATGVTWDDTTGPVALANLGTRVAAGANTRVTIFGLVNPGNTAAGNVTVTFTAGGLRRAVVGVVNYEGVDQTAPGANAFFADNPNSTTPSVVVCPAAPAGCNVEPGDLVTGVLSTYNGGFFGTSAVTIDPIAPATIAFDAASSANSPGPAASINWMHTIGTANVRKLIVSIAMEEDNSGSPTHNCGNPVDADVTNLTYNGVAMTHIPAADVCVQSANGFMQRQETWYMDQVDLPVGGAYTIAATLAGTVDDINAGAISLDNAVDGVPEAVATSSAQTAGSITTAVGAGASAGAWLVDSVGAGDAGSFTPGANQTERVDTTNASSSAAMSTKPAALALANSMTQTHVPAPANRLAHSVLRIAPHCPAAGCATGFLYDVNSSAGSPFFVAHGVAWAHGGAGATTLSATIAGADEWALGGVLLKKLSTITQAVVGDVRAWSEGSGATVEWQTLAEFGTLGFHLQRFDAESKRFVRLNKRLLPGLLHSRTGGIYRFHDKDAAVGESHVYRLVEVEVNGDRRIYGPYEVTVDSFSGHVDTGAASDQPTENFQRVQRAASPAQERRQVRKKAARAKAKARRARRKGPAAKVSVRSAGLYRLDAARIAETLGLSSAKVRSLIREQRLELRNRGKRVSTLASRDRSSIYFYGEAIDSQYTEDNVYVLRVGKGRPMGRVESKRVAPVPGQSFPYTSHAEGNQYFLTHIFDDPDGDYWMWDFRSSGFPLPDCEIVAPPAVCNFHNFRIATPDLDRAAGSDARLLVRLHGGSDPEGSGDHKALISINGSPLTTVEFDGLVPYEAGVDVPLDMLRDDENAVQIDLQAGTPMSVVYINDMELTYPRLHRANAGALEVEVAGRRAVSVGGFESQNIWLLNVTDPRAPTLIGNTLIDHVADGYRVSTSAGGDMQRLVAVERDSARVAEDVVADTPSKLRRRRNRADWVLITSHDLLDTAEVLAAHRRSQGLETMVVDVEDVYDEFSHGIRSADAIWKFLRYAYTRWSVKPRYAVLAGDGSFDFKNYLGFGESLIPTLLTPTPRGLFPSDNLFADVDGNDWIPEIAIGRLPVIDAPELRAVIEKLIAYERSGDIEGWGRRVVVSADGADADTNFTADSVAVANLVPMEYAVNPVHVDVLGQGEARNQMLDNLSDGSVYVNFYGHGGNRSIGNFNPGLLTTDDVANLHNGVRLPVITAFTCLSGQFGFPGFQSVSESLLVTGDGGAASVWAPSGLSDHALARVLGEAFYRGAFDEAQPRVGDNIRKAQQGYVEGAEDRYLLDIYNLIGDPATPVK